jgi:hypothetical protein
VGLNLRFNPDEPVYTSRRICRWVSKIAPPDLGIIWVSYVTNREQGTRLVPWSAACLRTGLAGTIFLRRLAQTLSQPRRVFRLTCTMTDEDERELESELARLQQEHRDLDAAIDALHQSPAPDLLRLQRLKKRKLQLRDRIAFIEDQITPDIIA